MSNMNDAEQAKWMVSRIDLVHKNSIEYLLSGAKQIENEIDKIIKKIKEMRSYLLTPVGVALTVLVGSMSVFNLGAEYFLFILCILVGIGALVFLISIKIINTVENIALSARPVQCNAIFHLMESHGFITSSCFDLSQLDHGNLRNYMIFTLLLESAVMSSYSQHVKKLSCRYNKFSDLGKAVEEDLKKIEPNPDAIQKLFSVFDRTKPLPSGALKFVENELRKYDPLKRGSF